MCCICHRKHGVCMKVMIKSETIFLLLSLLIRMLSELIFLIAQQMLTCGECSVAMVIARPHSILPVLEVSVCS